MRLQLNEPEVLSFEDVQAQLSGIKAKFALDTGWDGTRAAAPLSGSPSASPTGHCPPVDLEPCTDEERFNRALKRKRRETENEGSPTGATVEFEGLQHTLQSARERNRIKRQVKFVERQPSGCVSCSCIPQLI